MHAGDLDPSTSPHHLIPLKRAYVKLRYLVDKGYTFVGHGLRYAVAALLQLCCSSVAALLQLYIH